MHVMVAGMVLLHLLIIIMMLLVFTCGMLRSSTNTTMDLPAGGPYTPLRRFSSLPSMMS
jgi:hypothetical protein